MINDVEIQNPRISSAPIRPQQVLTIGLVRDLVVASFTKVGRLLNDLDYYLYNAAQAYNSHSRIAVNRALADHAGVIPDYG
jgi:hypothetical protein